MDTWRNRPGDAPAGGDRIAAPGRSEPTPSTSASDALRRELQESLGAGYRIERELGGGGMSRVFVAEDTALGRRVALKVLPRELAGEISGDRFRREILLSAQLQHPHVVPVLAAGETPSGVPYFTMPFVDGESLRARIAAQGAMGATEAVPIFRDVARALAYAHERGVVHRDIKPDNVLLARRAALVADFGVAKALASARAPLGAADTGPALTRTGTSLGTPAYMAPEQIAGDATADHRVDLYAFGVLAYETLTGTQPFAGLSPQQLLVAQMTQTPARVATLRPDVPERLSDLVARCLEKDPDARPASAAEVLEALDAVTAGDPDPGAAGAMPRAALGRALALYAAFFVGGAAVAYAAMIGLGLPDWVFPGALVVMALGLPAILATALVHRRAAPPAARRPGGPASSGAISSTARALRARLTMRRTAMAGFATNGVFAVVVVLYMASRALGIGPAASLLSAGVLADRDPVLVSEFAAPAADSAVAAVAAEAFRTDLAQSRAVTLLSSERLRMALQRMQRPPGTVLTAGVARELARREGIKLVVEGDVRPVGGGYMIAARLVAPASGEVLAAFRESAADPGAIIGAIDRLSKQARAKIGESLKAVRAAPSLERVTTGSFAALEKYSQAMAAQRRGDDGARVTQLLTEATEIDSTFAMAYAQMCCLLSLSRSQAIDVGGRAMRYRDRLPAAERYQVEIIHAMDANEMEQVIGAARNALELDSLNASAHQALGVAFGRRREFDRAETHFRRAIVADSVRGDRPVGIRYSALARVQFMQGQVDAARRTLERGRQVVRGPGPPFPVLLAGLDFATGRYDDGDRKLREAAAAAPAGPGRRPLEAALQAADLMRGRLASASRALEATGAEAAKAGRRPQALALQVVIVQLTARVLGDTAAARRRLVTALEQYPLDAMAPADRPYLIVAQAHAMVGDTAAAAATMAAFDRAASDIVGRRGKQALDGVALTRAMVASARGDHQRAATFAREADVGNCPTCALDVLAQAYDGAGMADSARAVYERFVTLPHFERVYDGPRLAAAHERLGQLYVQQGDRGRAAAHYAQFVELWKGADPALQPRVRAAREALARLGAPS